MPLNKLTDTPQVVDDTKALLHYDDNIRNNKAQLQLWYRTLVEAQHIRICFKANQLYDTTVTSTVKKVLI